ncbi:hypothetical protein [Streptomyces tendae]|uniref:Uncharacterized protein n=1 Tax=Streptomyces tendae TaxID=1932 RepID=A0ABW7S8C7_STRTE
MQGRAAYRGPVDAVRRQHQRDAYAAFLTEANTYFNRTSWGNCTQQAGEQLGIPAGDESRREEINRHTLRIQAEAPTEQLKLAAAVIQLEGPEDLAAIARQIENHAHTIQFDARYGEAPYTLFDMLAGRPAPADSGHNTHLELLNAIQQFTETARSHLNDETARRS